MTVPAPRLLGMVALVVRMVLPAVASVVDKAVLVRAVPAKGGPVKAALVGDAVGGEVRSAPRL